MFHKKCFFFLCIALLSCHTFIPNVQAGHHGHNNDEGLGVLLAAGLLAKILHHHHHEEHHIHIPVPVHHESHGHHEHHEHHGSGTTRIYVHHPAPFHHLYGGMMGSPSFVRRMIYTPPGYHQPPPYPRTASYLSPPPPLPYPQSSVY